MSHILTLALARTENKGYQPGKLSIGILQVDERGSKAGMIKKVLGMGYCPSCFVQTQEKGEKKWTEPSYFSHSQLCGEVEKRKELVSLS
jgi:hypothetical protein